MRKTDRTLSLSYFPCLKACTHTHPTRRGGRKSNAVCVPPTVSFLVLPSIFLSRCGLTEWNRGRLILVKQTFFTLVQRGLCLSPRKLRKKEKKTQLIEHEISVVSRSRQTVRPRRSALVGFLVVIAGEKKTWERESHPVQHSQSIAVAFAVKHRCF